MHPERILNLIGSGFLILFANTLFAQTNLTDTLQTQNLEPVTVSSGYSKTSKVLVPTVSVSASEIENNTVKDLVSVMNQIPGVFVQSGALNTNRITIRGVGSRTLYGTNKIRAYFNGIPITNGIGETSIDSYDPDDLAYIEIVKGPKATQYGTNLGGTLLLNSKEPVNGTSISSKLMAGSFGMSKNTTSINYGDEKIAVHLGYGHLETDGFRENSNYNRNTWLLTTTYTINEHHQLTLLVNQIDYTAHIASSIGKTDYEDHPEKAAFTWKAAKGYENENQNLTGVSYSTSFSNTFSNTTSVYYNYTDHYEPRPFNILDEYTGGLGARTLFAKNIKLPKGNSVLSWGGEWYNDTYHWKTWENLYEDNNGNGSLEGTLLSKNKEYRRNLNIFGTFKFPVTDRLRAEMGINFNKTSYEFQDHFNTGEANTSANRSFDGIMAPNMSVTYGFNKQHQLYGNISRGFNYPSLEETLTPEGVINPKIAPEKGWNYEVGGEFYFLNRQLYLNAAAYILNIKDLLVAERTGDDQYIGRNAGKTLHRGVELQATYSTSVYKQWQLVPFVNMSLNFHKFGDFMDGDDDFSGNDLTGVPNTNVSGGFTLQHQYGFYVYTNCLQTGSMPMNDANTLYTDSYELLNVRIGYKRNLTDHFFIQAMAGINNLADTRYASSILINATAFGNAEPRYYYPGEPVNYYGSLSMKYVF